jgi:hypothetical protein
LPILAAEFQISEGVGCHISDCPLHRREMVEGLQEARDVER